MDLMMALGSGWVVGLILGMVTGLVVSLFLLKETGMQWVWQSRKVEALELELAQEKQKVSRYRSVLG
jgi:hypothetical protein